MSVVGFDIETTTLCGYDKHASVISYAWWDWEGRRAAHPLDHPQVSSSIFYPWPQFTKASGVTVAGHNLFFDVAYWEARTDFRVTAPLFDTMVAHALIDETHPNSLGDVAQKYLGYGKIEGLDRRKLLEYPLDEVLEYNLQDAKLAYDLYEPLKEDLRRLDLERTFDLRMRALRVLIDMHHRGVGVDHRELERRLAAGQQRLGEIETEIGEMHPDLLMTSPIQLREVLYGKYCLPHLKSTPKGEPSTDKETLDALTSHAEGDSLRFLTLLKEHREVTKLVGTYLGPLPDHIGRDGRVHPSYHVAKGQDYGRGKTRYKSFGTVTGRLSSSNPNFQNVAKDERVRSCFVPRPGYKLLDADYAQIEVRVGAWLSGDPAMLEMIREGRDYHTHTLALIEGRPYEEVQQLVKTSAMWRTKRDTVKRVNFGIMYGAYPPTIKKQIEATGVQISLAEVRKMWYGWKETYGIYVAWEQLVQETALEMGEVVSPIGGRRRFAEGQDRARQARQASNFLIQGTAADIMLMGLTALDESLRQASFDAAVLELGHLIATVHDSVTVEYSALGWDVDDLRSTVHDALVQEPLLRLQRIEGVQRLEDLFLEVDIELGKERWLK